MTPESSSDNLALSALPFSERDPEDILTISQLVRAGFILLGLLSISLGLNFYLVLRKADLIVVDKTSAILTSSAPSASGF